MDDARAQLADLAAQLSGEPQAETPEEQPQEEAQADIETEEVEIEAAEVTESEDTPEQESTDDAATETSTEEIPSSVGELAEAIGWEASDIYDLKIPMGGDGRTITIGEFKDRVEGLETATDQLEKQRIELAGKESEMLQQMANVPQELLNARAKSLALGIQFEGINWAELESTDPGRAALTKQNLAAQYQAAQVEEQQAMATIQQRQDAVKQQTLAEQGQVLLERIPEWKDSTVRDTEQQAIVAWGESEGLSRDGLLTLGDASVVAFLRKMWKRGLQVSEADADVKKVRKAPKMFKPGSTQKKVSSSSKREAQIIQQSKRSGLKTKDRDNLAVQLMREAGVK